MGFGKPEGFAAGSKLQDWLAWLTRGRVVGATGIDVAQTADGVLLTWTPDTLAYPFKINLVNESGVWKAKMTAGVITSLQGAANALIVPAATLTFTVNANNYFYLACVVNDFSASEG